MSKIKLIASDLDGTLLLNGAQSLGPDTCSLIRRLREAGILFFAASGRQYPNLRRLFAPVQEDIGYLCENGCTAYWQGRLLFRERMDRALGQEILTAILQKDGAEALLSGEMTSYLQPKDMAYVRHMREVVRNDVTLVPDLLDTQEEYMKISVCEPAGLQDAAWWQERFGSRCTVVTSGNIWLDMMPKGVNKGTALRRVLDALGIPAEACMAIGDNDNDREMLELCGFPASVRSARPQIRALARYEDDTVEQLFRRILAGEIG